MFKGCLAIFLFIGFIIIVMSVKNFTAYKEKAKAIQETESKKITMTTTQKETTVKKTAPVKKAKKVQDWTTLSKNLVRDYQGKIVSIEQLNSTTCWAVLRSSMSHQHAIDTAESIGTYIRNSTGGIKGKKPTVRVFVDGKHIALARALGMKYLGNLEIQNWSAYDFKGQYKP